MYRARNRLAPRRQIDRMLIVVAVLAVDQDRNTRDPGRDHDVEHGAQFVA